MSDKESKPSEEHMKDMFPSVGLVFYRNTRLGSL